ncbi:CRISPR-associated endonuclease Cas2 [Gordonia sp. (in: high G+C Gram-positive bacteria)]|uniref:CRISPR-associated endonuclease Cas2 n=1 Tax=Gordonia sp. (in: high G+C Gram-positive bacteria) TaxID=84139 RepID=UPI001DC290FF|nr:CRISPR-associated endonuclease Cas2 [Gordonia sp. (in: high G+C Gram-positive bacteria)]MCB1293998.1 CRISPR-associated endonuclease Cas2 [Gordonia sp. (in: high G+C Gram-positive bacteria)]HMS75563.1 CRISPR-associated endonuclease Cas2 [Gordonia sp. (in: high G+C Gram-positive bacteria)]HQV16852.1 CRISPR-associated endonuclease Cas2 [Gordonia sp. (in: high G+C Gram-positive bacteria)]
MNLVLTYDVATTTDAGKRRLRKVAKICEGFGQRVQYSVFEIVCSPTDLARLTAKLKAVIDPAHDSLRIYLIHAADFSTVTHLGQRRELPFDDAWTL